MRVEMLSDMHDKLSQAVKLYDSILTDQVRYCSSHSPPHQSQQRIPSSSNQWTPVSLTSQVTSQQYVLPSQSLMQRHDLPRNPTSALQHVGLPPVQPTLQRSQSLVSAPHSPQNQAYVPVPPSMAAIVSTPQDQPQMSSQFTNHRSLVSYALMQQHQQGAHLGRNSTVAHPSHHPTLHEIQSPYQQQHWQQESKHHYQPPQVQHQQRELPSTLPQFPLVPTAAPMHDVAIHNGAVQRKEVMLIDL